MKEGTQKAGKTNVSKAGNPQVRKGECDGTNYYCAHSALQGHANWPHRENQHDHSPRSY